MLILFLSCRHASSLVIAQCLAHIAHPLQGKAGKSRVPTAQHQVKISKPFAQHEALSSLAHSQMPTTYSSIPGTSQFKRRHRPGLLDQPLVSHVHKDVAQRLHHRPWHHPPPLLHGQLPLHVLQQCLEEALIYLHQHPAGTQCVQQVHWIQRAAVDGPQDS